MIYIENVENLNVYLVEDYLNDPFFADLFEEAEEYLANVN